MDTHRRDEGSALILVLVLMVVGSLVVLPLMSYAISIGRANTVLSEKTKRIEAVRGALRVALAEPARLYEVCGEAGPTTSRSLASAGIDGIAVSSRCYFIDFASAQDENELRYGLTATQAGQTIPVELMGSRHVPADPTDPASWLDDTELETMTDRVWLPNLPVHALNLRSPAPYQMPAGFPACNVYFPGTYLDPVVLDGPTFFTSGVYYFESEVSVVEGADVVAGQGAVMGCSTDQEAAFYVENPPGTHNINGQGVTWVFGDEGRLVVGNGATTPVSLRFNQRYVVPDDTGATPSQGVSIMSVNGAVVDSVAGDLDIESLIRVPLSYVGSVDAVPAPLQEYQPSTLTPAPRAPSPPPDLTAEPRSAHIRVDWSPPDVIGGSPITGYAVTIRRGSDTFTCSTPADRTECTIGGLTNGQAHSVEVVATNEIGDSEPTVLASTVTPTSGSGAVTVPGVPAITDTTPYLEAVEVTWSPPASDGHAPITEYEVTAHDAADTVVGSCTAGYAATSCVVTGLAALPDPDLHVFRVVATNMIGASAPSVPSAGVALGTDPVPDPEPDDTELEPFVPEPIVDFDLASASPVVVQVPGYVSIPQGRFRIHNPTGQPVTIEGGVLAASFDVLDGRAGDPADPADQSVPIGFIETVVQGKFRIVSETTSGTPRVVSTAIVQVNQNGGYAINSWEVQ